MVKVCITLVYNCLYITEDVSRRDITIFSYLQGGVSLRFTDILKKIAVVTITASGLVNFFNEILKQIQIFMKMFQRHLKVFIYDF